MTTGLSEDRRTDGAVAGGVLGVAALRRELIGAPVSLLCPRGEGQSSRTLETKSPCNSVDSGASRRLCSVIIGINLLQYEGSDVKCWNSM